MKKPIIGSSCEKGNVFVDKLTVTGLVYKGLTLICNSNMYQPWYLLWYRNNPP